MRPRTFDGALGEPDEIARRFDGLNRTGFPGGRFV
jgi:hypothetical protein